MHPTVESTESPLGRWTLARWSPTSDSQLWGLVAQIWYFEGVLAHAKERVFPDGRSELVVMLDEPHRDGDVAALPAFPAVCINGLRTRPSVVVAPPGRCRVLGIRLEPLGACALIRSPIREVLDVTIDLRDARGRASDELAARAAAAAETSAWNPARNAVAVLHHAAEWTLDQFNDSSMLEPAVSRTERIIRSRRGVVSVDEIAAEFGLARSQLSQRFRNRIGVTPKRFARIVRFSNALSVLGRVQTIATAAAELAYFDQAHMYRDFEEFAGMAPGAFLRATRYTGSSSLAEQ